jgi:type III secretory pathway component EscT
MHVVLAAVPAAADAITVPLVLTVALATVALGLIALYVRRRRLAGQLNRTTVSASVISAAGVLVSAMLITIALGNVSVAVATTTPAPSVASTATVTPPISEDLSGYQLPTE